MALADHELDTDAQYGTEDLTAVVDADDDELDILGHAMSFTVGDFEVPREWVVDRMDELELPSWMVPRAPTPKRAYNRVRNRLVDDDGERIVVNTAGRDRSVRVFTKKIDKATFQIDADVMYDAEELEGEEAGKWQTTTLGKVKYVYDDQAIMVLPEIDSESDLWDTWVEYAGEAMDEFERYQEIHIGEEFQKVLNRLLNDWTNSVMMRDGGAYYFVPARHMDTLEKLGQLFEDMDRQWKETGRRVELKTIPVISDKQRREMVLREAEDEVEVRVEDAIDEIEEEIADVRTNDDANMDEVVDEIVDVFEDQMDEIDDFAAEYNALLEAELGVRDVLEAQRGDVIPEAEDVVDRVLN